MRASPLAIAVGALCGNCSAIASDTVSAPIELSCASIVEASSRPRAKCKKKAVERADEHVARAKATNAFVCFDIYIIIIHFYIFVYHSSVMFDLLHERIYAFR